MRIPEDIPWVKALLEEAEQTGRPIEKLFHGGTWAVISCPNFDGGKGNYRVQPAPPQPKFRPMTKEELMYEVDCGTVVYGKSIGGSEIRGALAFFDRSFIVAGAYPDLATLRFASKTDDRYGQPLQVEIKDDPQ